MGFLKLSQLAIANPHYIQALIKINDHTRAYGLILSETDAARVVAFTDETLRNLGRIELSSELIPKIAKAFCSSPSIIQEDYADTLCRLLECFYYLKNESRDRIGDDDLIEAMRAAFDQDCHGAVELLNDKLRRQLAAE